MIWDVNPANGKPDLAFIENTMDLKHYTAFLEQFLLPFPTSIMEQVGTISFLCKIMPLYTDEAIQKNG